MAWTATLESKEQLAGRIKLRVIYTDGTDSFTESVEIVAPGDAKAALRDVQRRLDQLDRMDTIFQAITVGPIDFSPLDPILPAPPTPPTPQELARRTWVRDFTRLRAALLLVDMGVLVATNPQIIALRATVTADFLPAYIDSVEVNG